jgi:hypothetical protein
MRPMNDPPSDSAPTPLRRWLVHPRVYWQVLQESVSFYILHVRDHEAALNEIRRDFAVMKLKEEEASKSSAEDKSVIINEDAIAEKTNQMFPSDNMKTVKDFVRTAWDKKDDIKAVATDRLEIMSEALHTFLDGYREGKKKAMDDIAARKCYKEQTVRMYLI